LDISTDQPVIVLATHNSGKLKQMQAWLSDLHIQLISQAELGVSDIEETGSTFIENALLKARHAAQATGLPALSDDSGLEIDALNGEPGIYSARYGGNISQSEKNAKILAELQDTPEHLRTARYRCVLVYVKGPHDPSPAIFETSWEGRVLLASEGVGGFGYDPIITIPELSNNSVASLPDELRAIHSHRAKALQQFKLFYCQKTLE